MTLALLLLMLLLSAFFSGSEIAFVTANRLRTTVRARGAGWVGRMVQEFLEDPATVLTTCLVGNNVALVLYSTLMSLTLDGPLTDGFELLFGAEAHVAPWVLAAQTVIAAFVVLVLGEVIPKSLLRNPSGRVILSLAGPLKLTYWLLSPLITLAGWTSNLLVRLVGAPNDTVQQFLRRDFELIIRESRETGQLDLDDEESEILSNVFELRALRVKDSMVPRTEIRSVEETMPLDAVRQMFIDTGFSRLPVTRESVDRVTGVVLAHDLFHEPASLSDILRPVRFVPESKPARDLLFDFLRGDGSLAIVVDEFGGTAGIVTLEDLLEELFGDIRDEHDPAAAPVRRLSEGVYLVHGRVELETLAATADLSLPEGEYDTVAGYLLDRIGNVPDEGESFTLDGLRFTVLKAARNRIEVVRITAG